MTEISISQDLSAVKQIKQYWDGRAFINQVILHDGRTVAISRQQMADLVDSAQRSSEYALQAAACRELGYAYDVQPVVKAAPVVDIWQPRPARAATPTPTAASQARDAAILRSVERMQANYSHRNPITGHFRGGGRGQR